MVKDDCGELWLVVANDGQATIQFMMATND